MSLLDAWREVISHDYELAYEAERDDLKFIGLSIATDSYCLDVSIRHQYERKILELKELATQQVPTQTILTISKTKISWDFYETTQLKNYLELIKKFYPSIEFIGLQLRMCLGEKIPENEIYELIGHVAAEFDPHNQAFKLTKELAEHGYVDAYETFANTAFDSEHSHLYEALIAEPDNQNQKMNELRLKFSQKHFAEYMKLCSERPLDKNFYEQFSERIAAKTIKFFQDSHFSQSLVSLLMIKNQPLLNPLRVLRFNQFTGIDGTRYALKSVDIDMATAGVLEQIIQQLTRENLFLKENLKDSFGCNIDLKNFDSSTIKYDRESASISIYNFMKLAHLVNKLMSQKQRLEKQIFQNKILEDKLQESRRSKPSFFISCSPKKTPNDINIIVSKKSYTL